MHDKVTNGWATVLFISKVSAALVSILAAFWIFVGAPTTRVIAREEAEKAVASQQHQLERIEAKIDTIEAYLRDGHRP